MGLWHTSCDDVGKLLTRKVSSMRSIRTLAFAFASFTALACGPQGTTQSDEGALTDLDDITAEERLAYIERSQVWSSSDIARADLFHGPKADDGFEFNQEVVCRFIEPKKCDQLN